MIAKLPFEAVLRAYLIWISEDQVKKMDFNDCQRFHFPYIPGVSDETKFDTQSKDLFDPALRIRDFKASDLDLPLDTSDDGYGYKFSSLLGRRPCRRIHTHCVFRLLNHVLGRCRGTKSSGHDSISVLISPDHLQFSFLTLINTPA